MAFLKLSLRRSQRYLLYRGCRASSEPL